MMPDQIVGASPDRGVALICQSGTIALTLMFNDRSLPIGCLFTVGNQTRLAVEDLIDYLCDDPRVTAFGLYLEGIKDAEGVRARRRPGALRRQTHRGGEVGPDGRRRANRPQPHRRPGGRGFRVRGILQTGRNRPLRTRWARCARH